MSTYQPAYVPDDPAMLPGFLRQEFLGLKQSFETGSDALYLKVLFAEPKKYVRGQLAYADGTTWNPGAGEGVYVRKSASWVLLG